MTLTFTEFLKLSRLFVFGIPFLFFSGQMFIRDYKIDKRIENELFIDSGVIKSYSSKTLPALKNVLADPPAEVTIELTNNKKYYSDKFIQIIVVPDFDDSLFTKGHKVIFKAFKEKSNDGMNKFVELNVDGKQLLTAEKGDDDFKKTEVKYYILVMGLLFTTAGIFAIYFFRKEKSAS